MHRENGVHGVSQRRGEAEFRPGHVLALPMGLGPVPPGTHPPSIDPQGQTARHVGDDGREDEERLEREGLVVWPREEEVFVGFPGRLGYQGYETGVGIVHGEVDGGRDGGVFLQAGQDLERGRGRETEEVGRVVRRGWKRLFLDIGGVGRILRGSSSSTGLGSTSFMGTAEMEEQVSLSVSGGRSLEADIASGSYIQ